MTGILGISPPPEEQGPDTLSPEVARDGRRDAIRLALHDMWLNGLMGFAFLGATVLMTWLSYRRPLRLSAAVYPPLPWQFGFLALLSCLSAVDAWRAFRRMRAADAALPHRSWISRRSRQIILVLLLVGVGYQVVTRRQPINGPIVFLHATIRTSTGFPQQNMTIAVAVAGGRVAFVGGSEDELPASLSGARRLDAGSAMVSAATFDHSVAAPLDALRHIWAGQLYEGAPGDLVISNFTPLRSRGRMPEPREILGAVVSGRYYSASELERKH